MTKNQLLLLLIAVGCVAGLISFGHRFQAEARNRQVELVIDYADAQALANTMRQQSDKGLNPQMDAVLTQLRQAGITTVAVTEQSLDSLRSQGVFTYRREGETTILTFAPGASSGRQRARMIEMLAHKTGLPPAKPVGANTLVVGAPWTQFNGIPVGLDGDEVDAVRRNGLLVAPRLLNWVGVNDNNIHWDLARTQAQCATRQGLGPFIFAGSAVLGNRGLIPATANALAENNLTYGSVEFAKTFGDDDLARRAAAGTVRVHSIGLDEMGTMDEPTAIERFVRAARE
ncbi:MAG: DUF5693 family protein, partial [Armatimonadota bacterium]|nr:DUF5693 family protein [Armatimonadota bacterium]